MQSEGKQGRIAIGGEMTIYTAAELKDKLIGLLEACDNVEVDLSGVSEIDTAGQQLLVLAKQESMIRSKSLRLVRHSPAVVDLLDLCGLAGFFGDPILMHRKAA